MSSLEFKPLAYEKVSIYTRMRPRIPTPETIGYIRGELVSLHQAKDALLFAMNFYPCELGESQEEAARKEPGGRATFLLVKKGSDYFGRIVEGAGISQGIYGSEKFKHVGSTKSYPGHPGRGSAVFLLTAWGKYPANEVSVWVFLRTRLFGGWKDVVIQVPEGNRYIARP